MDDVPNFDFNDGCFKQLTDEEKAELYKENKAPNTNKAVGNMFERLFAGN